MSSGAKVASINLDGVIFAQIDGVDYRGYRDVQVNSAEEGQLYYLKHILLCT
ncbi:MAG: hypothetical protein V3U87_16630 [Methylococcaceae bacterium]